MIAGVVLLAAVGLSQANADEVSAHKQWVKAYQGIAGSIEMRRGGEKLTLHTEPLHFYTNPVRMNDQHGAIFLWTEAGRPAVIASIWSALDRQNRAVRIVTHEWHSLAVDADVTAMRGGVRLWTSGEAGAMWRRLEDGAPTATTRPQRLVQMRSLARRYSAGIDVEEESDLRLLNQPLFRYPGPVEGAVDGAIFAFAMATDPELLVWLEAREGAADGGWHVAFARFGNKAMSVSEGGREVWKCEAGTPGYSDGKYYLHWRAEEMPARADR